MSDLKGLKVAEQELPRISTTDNIMKMRTVELESQILQPNWTLVMDLCITVIHNHLNFHKLLGDGCQSN
jgi:hypothetical protein